MTDKGSSHSRLLTGLILLSVLVLMFFIGTAMAVEDNSADAADQYIQSPVLDSAADYQSNTVTYKDSNNNEYYVEDGVLYITKGTSGSGVMSKFTEESNLAGTLSITENFTTVSMDSTMTTVGDYAFYEDADLTDITMPSVKTIGKYSFYQCENLALASLPDGLTSIDDRCFFLCTNLALTSLPDGLTRVPEAAFVNCINITLTSLPSKMKSIGTYGFQGCTKLALTSLPEGIALNGYAFSGCTNLALTSLPNSITTLNDSVFQGCTSLALTSLPNGLTTIDYDAFSGCTKLALTSLPESVKTIQWRAFSGCTKLALTSLPSGLTEIKGAAFRNCTNLQTLTLPDGLTSIEDYAFRGCTGLQTLTIPVGVTSISKLAFEGCTSLTEVTVPNTLATIGQGAFALGTTSKSVTCNVYGCADKMLDSYKNSYTTFVYNGGYSVTYKLDGTQYGNIDTCYYGDSVTVRDKPAKSGYTVSDWISEDVTIIDGKFTMPAKDVVITATSTQIVCTVTFDSKDGTEVPSQSVNYGSTATEPADPTKTSCVFKGWYNDGILFDFSTPITEDITLTAGWSCTDTNGNVFTVIDDTLTITKGESGTGVLSVHVDSIAGLDMTGVTTVNFSTGITDIGTIINGKTGVETVTMTDEVITLHMGAFSGCASLSSITLSKSLTKIDEIVFAGCTHLQHIDLHEGITQIGEYAFQNSGLVDITLPSTLTNMDNDAFDQCSKLKTVIALMDKPTSNPIGTNFVDATTIAVKGGKGAIYRSWWDNLADKIYEMVSVPTAATDLLYDGTLKTGVSGDKYTFTDNTATDAGDYTAKVTADRSKKYVWSDGTNDEKDVQWSIAKRSVTITSDSASKVYDGEPLTAHNVTVTGDGFISGQGAAYDYTGTQTEVGSSENTFTYTLNDGTKASNYDITTVYGTLTVSSASVKDSDGNEYTISGNTLTIVKGSGGNGILATKISEISGLDMTGVTTLHISTGITQIGNSIFSQQTGITTVTMDECVTTLGMNVFEYCTSLSSVTLSTKITVLDDEIFYYCADLKQIELHEGLTKIGEFTFQGTGLTEITLPSTITKMDVLAFSNCVNLTKVTALMDEPNDISDYTFRYATKIIVKENKGETYRAVWANYSDIIYEMVPMPTAVTGLVYDGTLKIGVSDSRFIFTNNTATDAGDYTATAAPDITQKYVWSDGTYGAEDIEWSIAKAPTEVKTSPSATALKENIALSNAEITGGTVTVKSSSITVEGSFAWEDPTLLIVKDTLYTAVFTPTNSNYETCEVSIKVLIMTVIDSNGVSYTVNGSVLTIAPNTSTDGAMQDFNLSMNVLDWIESKGITASITSVVFESGMKVIGEYAFHECTDIETVTFSDTLTAINRYSFDGCTGIQSVSTPDSLESIENNAFANCTGITSLELNGNDLVIKNEAFTYLPAESVTIGAGVKSVETGDSAMFSFKNMTDLKEFIVSLDNPYYSGVDGIICSKDTAKILMCPSGKQLGDYVLPDNVEEIGMFAFYDNSSLTSFSTGLDPQITNIGKPIYCCNNLKTIDLSTSSITGIQHYAFSSTNFDHIILPSTVVDIGEAPFPNKSLLVTVLNEIPCNTRDDSFYSEHTILVPCDTVDTYRAHSEWIDFKDQIFGDVTAPEAIDFLYDGTEHSQTTGTGYSYIGTSSATDAGDYSATATLGDKFRWSDGTSADVVLEWSISKRTVKFTSGSASKVYDGTPLTNSEMDVSGDGFITGEGAEYSIAGSQMIAGTSNNEFTYTLSDSTKGSNYDITAEYGKLTVTKITASIIITADSDSKMYDGTALADSGYTFTDGVVIDGDKLTAVTSGSITDCGSEYNIIASYKVMRGDTEVTGCYTFSDSVDGTLTVTERSVTLTSGSSVRNYDGTPLTNHNVTVTGDGFITGEGAAYEFTGTQTQIGFSENTFTYTLNDKTKAVNYTISVVYGKLTVKSDSEIIITANSNSKTYDGTPLTDSGYTYTLGILVDGDELTVTIEGTITYCGTVGNKVVSHVVMRGDVDVTGCYTFGSYVDGTLTVTKRTIDISWGGLDSKVYNHNEQEFKGTVTGIASTDVDLVSVVFENNKMTNVSDGPKEVTAYIDASAVLLECYSEGTGFSQTCEITPLKLEIDNFGMSTKVYDGNVLYNSFLTTNNLDGGNLIPYAEFNSKDVADADTIKFKLSGPASGNYTAPDDLTSASITKKQIKSSEITWTVTEFTYSGVDQSSSVQAEYEDEVLECTVTIDISFMGISGAAKDKDVFKNAGTYTASPESTDNNYSSAGCEISIEILPISDALIITTGSASRAYDGTPLTSDEYEYTDGVLVDGDVITVITCGTITDFGEAANDVSSYIITDGDETVTGCYSGITIVKGTLSVTVREVTIRSDDAERKYTGEPLTAETVQYTVGSFVSGEGATYVFTKSITNVGSIDNEFTYTLDDGTKAANYDISIEFGTLKVTNADIYDIVVTPYNDLYDGDSHPVVTYSAKTVNDQDLTFQVSKNGGTTWTDIFDVRNVSDSITVTYYMSAPNHTTVTKSLEAKVLKRTIEYTSATESREYNGAELKNDVLEIEGDGFADGEGASYNGFPSITFVGTVKNDFAIQYDEGTDVSNYDVKVTYGELTVLPISTPITITADSSSKVYDGTALTCSRCTYTTGVILVSDIIEVTVTGSGTDAGEYPNIVESYRIIHIGKDVTDCYTFTDCVAGVLTVEKRSVTLTSDSDSKVYDGTPLTCEIVYITGDGFVDGQGLNFSNFRSVTDVGTYDNTFTYTFDSKTNPNNYAVDEPVLGELTVTGAEFYDIDFDAYLGTYDGQEHNAAVYSAESVNEMEITWKFSRDSGTTWTDIFTVKDCINKSYLYRISAPNHNTVTAEFTVTVNSKPLVLSSADTSISYGSDVPELTADSGSGWVTGENYGTYGTTAEFVSSYLTTNYKAGDDAGQYSITWKSGASDTLSPLIFNYSLILDISQLNVEKAQITDVSVVSYDSVYDGESHNIIVSISAKSVNEQPLSYDYSDDDGVTWYENITVKDAMKSTEYLFRISAPNHKDIEGTVNVKIDQFVVGLSWTAPSDLTYDGTAKIPEVIATGIITGDECSVTAELTEGCNNVDCGRFTFMATELDNDNYSLPKGTESEIFTIVPKTIEIKWTAPDDLVYDRTEKVPYAEITNLISGDECDLSIKANDSDNINVGDFTFKAISVTNGNYCVDGDMISPVYHISERTIGLEWSAVSDLTYDGKEKTVKAEATGLCEGDTCEVSVTPVPGMDLVNVGQFVYCATGLGNSNYGLPDYTVSPAFKIEKANILVKPDSDQSKIYTEKDPVFTYTWSGNIEGETPEFTGSLDRLPGSDAGQYMINKGTLKLVDNGSFISNNYELYVPYIVYFTIVPKEIVKTDFIIDGNDEIYTGKGITKTVTSDLIQDIDYKVSYRNNVNVGTAAVIIDGISNYEGQILSYFVIVTRTVDVPGPMSYLETGSEITFEIPESPYYTETSGKDHKGTAPGTYEFKLTIDKNCVWSESEYDGSYYVFITVYEKSHTNESGHTDVIVTAEDGLLNELVLVSKATDDTSSVTKILSEADGDPKYMYDVKLLLNGVEVEPEKAITVYLLIPNNLRGTDFSIYHIHDNNAKQIRYSVEGEYAVVEVDQFSDLVFVGGDIRSEPLPAWAFAIILLAALAAICVCIYWFTRRKSKAE